jgi:hypothetical protein
MTVVNSLKVRHQNRHVHFLIISDAVRMKDQIKNNKINNLVNSFNYQKGIV